jgi:dihydrofolate synthase/folylpolyglutamate synthase
VLNWQGKALTLPFDVGHNPHAAEYLARQRLAEDCQASVLPYLVWFADKD